MWHVILDEVEMRDKKGEAITLRHFSPVLHTRKCIQHRSPSTEETEIEKGKSEFAHLGKISHWRQSISKSVLLKRARWKYSSSQHKRRWHTFQSIGYRHCAGKFHIKEICKNLKVMKDGDAQQHTQISASLKKSNDPLLSNQSY